VNVYDRDDDPVFIVATGVEGLVVVYIDIP
jgi:hypothetical protein